jgi:hypothetical protein
MARSSHGLKVSPQPFNALRAGHPPKKSHSAVFRVACPQGEWPAAVFYPLGYPMPDGPGKGGSKVRERKILEKGEGGTPRR